jgi:hypothetical protein
LGWTWWQIANDSRDHANLTEIDKNLRKCNNAVMQ